MREQLFPYLPYQLKKAAASVEALRLHLWRYGSRFEQQVSEVAERDHWSAEQWRSWQEGRLRSVLARAASTIPLYQKVWDDRPGGNSQASVRELSEWPVLSKDSIRTMPAALQPSGLPKRLFHEHTSGSTGTPLSVLFTRRVLHQYYAIYEQRVRRWNGVDRATRWAILGGRIVANVERRKPPYWVWNPVSKQLYLSSYHLSEQAVGDYATALARHRVEYLVGYPSAIFSLARLSARAGATLPRLRVVVANAEPVLEHQRDDIEAAFGSPLRATYGMSEMVLGASECVNGTMHLWPDVGLLEVLDDEGRPVPPGTLGRVVATSLLNSDTPLIRYETGDCAVAPSPGKACGCGRSLQPLGTVEGRLDDVIVCPDGRHIGRLDPVFKADLHILEAQIEQTDPSRLLVRIVPADGFGEDDAQSVRQRLRSRVGAMDIAIEEVPHISRTAAGKFRAVVGMGSATPGPGTANQVIA